MKHKVLIIATFYDVLFGQTIEISSQRLQTSELSVSERIKLEAMGEIPIEKEVSLPINLTTLLPHFHKQRNTLLPANFPKPKFTRRGHRESKRGFKKSEA